MQIIISFITVLYQFMSRGVNQTETNDCMFQCFYQCRLSWPVQRAERETGKTKLAPHSQIITGKCVLGGGIACPSQRAGVAMVEKG